MTQSYKKSAVSKMDNQALSAISDIVSEVSNLYQAGEDIITIIQTQSGDKKVSMFRAIEPLLKKIDTHMPNILEICASKNLQFVASNSQYISDVMQDIYREISSAKKVLI